MKLRSFIILMLALTLLLCGCAAQEEGVPQGMKRLEGHTNDYSICVPKDWVSDKDSSTLSAYVSSVDSSSISVTAFALEAQKDLNSFWNSYKEDFEATFNGTMKYVGEMPVTTTLDKIPANKYVYTAEVTGTTYQFVQVTCINEGQVYIITFTTTPELYDDHTENIEKILQNFKFN